MTETPADIAEATEAAWNRARMENSPAAIEQAILAERERCAEIADRQSKRTLTARRIAREIRLVPHPPGREQR